MREPDIRARLGKLPKGLTGVYDEIIRSIMSQPECNSDLAIRALKWMMVSNRPLRPEELVTAAELDPAAPLGSSVLPQESVLAVDLLIQSCEGLLLLDRGLTVASQSKNTSRLEMGYGMLASPTRSFLCLSLVCGRCKHLESHHCTTMPHAAGSCTAGYIKTSW